MKTDQASSVLSRADTHALHSSWLNSSRPLTPTVTPCDPYNHGRDSHGATGGRITHAVVKGASDTPSYNPTTGQPTRSFNRKGFILNPDLHEPRKREFDSTVGSFRFTPSKRCSSFKKNHVLATLRCAGHVTYIFSESARQLQASTDAHLLRQTLLSGGITLSRDALLHSIHSAHFVLISLLLLLHTY